MIIYYLYKITPPNWFAGYVFFVRRFAAYFEYFLYLISHRLFKNLHLNLNAKITIYSHLQECK